MSAHPPLSAPVALDRGVSSNFTAVNGDTITSTSFRPLVQEDAAPVTQIHDQSAQLQQTGTSRPSQHTQELPQRDLSTQALSPTDGPPPGKRQRLNDDGTDRSGELAIEPVNGERNRKDSSSASPPDMTVIDEAESPTQSGSNDPQAQQSEAQTWTPQHTRQDSNHDLQERLQSHFNAQADAEHDPNVPQPRVISGIPGVTAEPTSTNPRATRKRDFAHRTKSGCHTCRQRKKKCDEGKPVCQNCIRGKFTCGGYGATNKNVNYKRPVNSKVHQHIIQARPPMEFTSPPGAGPSEPQWNGRPQGYPPPYEPSRLPQPALIPPPPMQSYGPPSHDPREPWRPPYADAQHIHLQYNKLSHVEYPPMHALPFHPGDSQPRPPTQETYPPLSYRPPSGAPAGFVPHDQSASRRGSHLPPMQTERELSERDKMLVGLPYRHRKDPDLIKDRLDCKTALDLYNRAALPSEAIGPDERALRFTAVLDPNKRMSRHGDARQLGRVGSCGERTIVDAPFYCDYGYNLIIGAETVIYPGCFIQDPCEISIGNRCTIGPNVHFYGMTFSIDTKSTAGSQGHCLGGSIRVEDDCKIGGNVTILAYRVIGRGAIVAAGSVVTRNVKPYTIVAGNPAKEVRTINESTEDRRMRTEIQEENERMIEEMKRRRNALWPGCQEPIRQ